MSVNNNKTPSKFVKPKSKGITKDIVNYVFYYGKGIQSKYIYSSNYFLTYIRTKFKESKNSPLKII